MLYLADLATLLLMCHTIKLNQMKSNKKTILYNLYLALALKNKNKMISFYLPLKNFLICFEIHFVCVIIEIIFYKFSLDFLLSDTYHIIPQFAKFISFVALQNFDDFYQRSFPSLWFAAQVEFDCHFLRSAIAIKLFLQPQI